MSSRLRVDHKLGPLHWDILDILQRADEWVSSQALHAGLRPGYGHSDAAAKTIQRALRRLLDAGFIEGRGRGSARAWRRFSDRSPNRTEVQSVELAVALLQLEQFAATQLPSDALQILRDHCDRSRELLDSHPTYPRYRQGRAWLGKAAVVDSGYPLIPPPQDEAIMQTILDGLYRGLQLSLRYRNAAVEAAEAATYAVTPLAFVERGSVLYLVSCRRSRRTGRHTRYMQRLDRIIEAAVTQMPVDPDPDFDLERFLRDEHTLLFFPEPLQRITMKVRERGFRSRLREYRLSEDQVIREQENGFELTATVRPSLTFKQFLLGLAPDAILIAPPALRDELQEILVASAMAYSCGGFPAEVA